MSAEAQAIAGMQLALSHQPENWASTAYAFLLSFARANQHFISEDVSEASKRTRTFPQPSTDRAWGSIYRRALKEGVIVQDGSGRSQRRHASICPRWRSLVYEERAA